MIAGSPDIQTNVYSSLDEAKVIMEEFIGKVAGELAGLAGSN
jgi:hypothetical protein